MIIKLLREKYFTYNQKIILDILKSKIRVYIKILGDFIKKNKHNISLIKFLILLILVYKHSNKANINYMSN